MREKQGMGVAEQLLLTEPVEVSPDLLGISQVCFVLPTSGLLVSMNQGPAKTTVYYFINSG